MRSIMFMSPGEVVLSTGEDLQRNEKTIIRNEISIVSPGTELAILSGNESWAPLPYIPGYGSVGKIEKAGSECGEEGLREGDRVFTYGKHAGATYADTVCVAVPEGLPPEKAAFARIAAVSITALRCSEIEVGDHVAVFGAGPVGNFAAQFARLAGARVCVIDPSPKRRNIAETCGADFTAAPGEGLADDLNAFVPGGRCTTVIDATGVPSVIMEAAKFVGRQGELILLGSPRGAYAADVTPFLNRTHLCPDVVTLKGAHEWRYPVLKRDAVFGKHSIERNIEIIFKAMIEKKLIVEPLITHHVAPEHAPRIYSGLKDDKDTYLGVVFDWTGKE